MARAADIEKLRPPAEPTTTPRLVPVGPQAPPTRAAKWRQAPVHESGWSLTTSTMRALSHDVRVRRVLGGAAHQFNSG